MSASAEKWMENVESKNGKKYAFTNGIHFATLNGLKTKSKLPVILFSLMTLLYTCIYLLIKVYF